MNPERDMLEETEVSEQSEVAEQPEVTEQPVEPDEPKTLDDFVADWNRHVEPTAPEAESPTIENDEPETEALPEFDPDDAELFNQLHSINTSLGAENAELLQEIQALRDQRAVETDKRELAAAVERIVELSETDTAPNLIESDLLKRYQQDELFHNAYNNRLEDPQEWDNQLVIAASDFEPAQPTYEEHQRALEQEALEYVAERNGTQIERDRERGGDFGSVNWGKLSPQEFEQKKREVFEAAGRGELQPERRGGAFFRT